MSDNTDNPDLWDAVVVTYNDAFNLIQNWLPVDLPERLTVTVVDNGSRDESFDVAELLGHHALRSTNVGLSKSNNRGALEGTAPYIVFCNPDVSISESTLAGMQFALDEQGADVVAPRLLGPDDGPQPNGRRWPTLPRIAANRIAPKSATARKYRWPDSRPDWVTGACVGMTRQTFINRLRWPEEYFLYFEDVQLCLNAVQAGLSVQIVESCTASHSWKRESGALLSPASAAHLKSATKFYRDNPSIAFGLGKEAAIV